jgi:hypothetical protein
MEFTRLDGLVDVMFTTATDLETRIAEAAGEALLETSEPLAVSGPSGWQFTYTTVLDAKRNQIIEAVSATIGSKLIKKSRALYWNASHEKRVACSISKHYTRGAYDYWYAYHPEWNEFLGEAQTAFFVLGCMDLPHAFAIPLGVVRSHLDALNTTTTTKKTYWHVHLTKTDDGTLGLVLPGAGPLLLTPYRIPIAS